MMRKRISICVLINLCLSILFNMFVGVKGVEQNEPKINARHAVVIERNTGEILFGKKENEKCKMASTTKIMTAIVVLEKCDNLKQKATISEKAASIGGSRLGLSIDCEITIQDLLYGLLMVSGNDAAVALAENISGSVEDFANLMNEKAKELQLENTHFVTPHGLDEEEHYTTAYDLGKIADYALQNATFAKIVKTSNYTIKINGKPKNLNNTNELLGYLEGIYGVKTGFTNGANRCLVTSCKRGNLDIICVVLGCDTKKDRGLDSINLINYIFDNFQKINIKNIIEESFNNWYKKHSNDFYIDKAKHSNMELYLNEIQIPNDGIAVKKDLIDKITTDISFESTFNAPLKENTIIGTLDVFLDKEKILSIEILNKKNIPRKSIIDYMTDFMENYFNYFETEN